MPPKCCRDCKYAVPVADGYSTKWKCEKENQWAIHTNCLLNHAIKEYLAKE